LKDIAFIDLEASGLSARSWPIEVGWCFVGGAPQARLIRPAEQWSLGDWSKEAEALHGVSHQTLLKEGADPKEVCEALNATLAGKAVYSDAPDWDGFWLYRLFQAAHARQRFALKDLGGLFDYAQSEKMDEIVAKAERIAPRRHRAAPDVLHMRALYELAVSEGAAAGD
jgi:hypothetical protein